MAYNAVHTGLEALLNVVLALAPCQEINIRMSPSYSIEGSTLVGAQYNVECIRQYNTDHNMMITFSAPIAREDGTPLSCDEVSKYKVIIQGGSVSAVACDTTGQCSEESLPVQIVE